MTEQFPSQERSVPGTTTPVFDPAALWRSLRVPILLLLTSAAVWLLAASVFALIGSTKFHSPRFLSDTPWLTYGRVRPAWFDALVYGFCLQAGLAIGLWLIAGLGQRTLLGSLAATVGGVFWNVGLTIGVPGILAGDSSGFEGFELPGYSVVFLFIGWLLIAIPALVTFHYRARRTVYVSLWFVLAALFWFPWIYSTACLLLISYPVRGMAQAVIAWWYSQNLTDVCLTMLGLAAAFYLVARITARPLHSRYLALFAFWVLALFTSWGGIPANAPVPAWMPTVSQISDLLNLLVLCAGALNVYQTGGPKISAAKAPANSGVSPQTATPLAFVLVGTAFFVVAGFMRFAASWLDPVHLLQFTWFSPARSILHIYGFVVLILFGAAYYLLPLITGIEFSWPKLVRIHYWLAVSGLTLIVLPFAISGVIQAVQLNNPSVPFMNTVKVANHFLRIASLGELLLLIGHVLFLANLAGLLRQLYQSHVIPVYETATEDLFRTAEGKV